MKYAQIIGLLLVSFSIQAQLSEKEVNHLTSVYEHLHENPETALKEVKTSEYLAKELKSIGLNFTHPIGGQGIAGLLENGDGPTILLRTDIDALPLEEQTNGNVKSQNPGVMHACGHDVHMTVWLGTLRHLLQNKDQWSGKVLFVAQSAEETGQGAKMMIKDGLFEKYGKPDYCLALHTSAKIASNQIGVKPGWFMANVDMLAVTVKGVGGHGASPQNTIDPVVIASKIVVDLQTLVSRELSPFEPGVVTVGSIHGGTVGNIIPNEVKLEMTIRSYGDETRNYLIDGVKRTCEHVAKGAGVPDSLMPEVVIRDMFTPALYNDPELTENAVRIWNEKYGHQFVTTEEQKTIGEDFSRYGRVADVPALLFSLGTVGPDMAAKAERGETTLPGLHSPFYFPDYEHAIPTGVSAMSTLIIGLCKD